MSLLARTAKIRQVCAKLFSFHISGCCVGQNHYEQTPQKPLIDRLKLRTGDSLLPD